MAPLYHRHHILLFLTLLPLALSQSCDQSIGETLLEDLTSLNPIYTTSTTLSSSASITATGTTLTSTSPSSHGTIFFSSPTDFQGTGGFSLKFVLQSSATGGDAWEAIVAGTSTDLTAGPFLGSAAPPYQTSGIAGWTRSFAFVVEFDAYDSGISESDNSAGHVAMYLSGAEICKTDVSVDFSSGDKYTIWLDFDGFATTAAVRVSSANGDERPEAATLQCVVDIWGTISITSDAYVGFAAYNPVSEDGVEHYLVDGISIADGYKPYDLDDCASYAKCSARDTTGLCTKIRDDGDCDVFSCSGAWIWDVAGDECCAFVERTSWVVAAGVEISEGDVVACTQSRSTIAYLSTADNCT